MVDLKRWLSLFLVCLLAAGWGAAAESESAMLLCFPLPEEAVILNQIEANLTFQLGTATWRTSCSAHREARGVMECIDDAYEHHSEPIACKTIVLEKGDVACYRFTRTFDDGEFPVYCAWHSDGEHDYLILADMGREAPEAIEALMDVVTLVPVGELTAAK